MTPEVVRYGKDYKNMITDDKSNRLALFVGLVCNLFFFCFASARNSEL